MKPKEEMGEQPNKEETIFDAALQISHAAERAAYLDRVCGENKTLRQRVEILLKAHEETANLLDAPPLASAKTIVISTAVMERTNLVGTQIGHYKLLEQIGEGGCGVVYVAEQEKPVRRRVALKLIKLGMDTRQVVARFEAERQALALMDHPNIAKVLDGGATESGRPYFVMELVRGIKITEYCDKNNLSTEERLKLFIQVCKAVQHAHQKGIIHRDIKPSNVLVTLHDGVPVPKVIDFGIAKATNDQRLTDKTLYTAFEQFMGTPAYMSPEQAEMSGLDIDTRSDIYSLGVLLYELLTGRTPFDHGTLMRAGIDQMRRIIREQEPPRPSIFLNTLTHADLTTVANHRRVEPPKLVHAIRGDLDWIVMKLLEKDRTRRYDSATGVAADIKRHLDNEPVVARPPSPFYRLRKMVRRNKLAFASVTSVLLVALAGLTVSTWLLQKERKSLQRALVAEKAQNRLQLEKEANEAMAHGEELFNTNYDGPESAEKMVEAEKLYRKAAAIRQELFGAKSAELLAALNHLVYTLQFRIPSKAFNAELATLDSNILDITRTLYGAQNTNCIPALNQMAVNLDESGHTNEAMDAYREIVSIWRKSSANNDRSKLIDSIRSLGRYFEKHFRLTDAESCYREVLALEREINASEYLDIYLADLAYVLQREGKLVEAEALLREAVALGLRPDAFVDPTTGLPTIAGWPSQYIHLAEVVSAEGKTAESDSINEDVIKMIRKASAGGSQDLLTRYISAMVDDLVGNHLESEGEKLIERLLLVQDTNLDRGMLLFNRGELRSIDKRFKSAAEDFAMVLKINNGEKLEYNTAYHASIVCLETGDLKSSLRYLEILRTNIDCRGNWFWDPIVALAFLQPNTASNYSADITRLDSAMATWHEAGGYCVSSYSIATVGNEALPSYKYKCIATPCGTFTLKALSEYRLGNFANALTFVRKALRYDERAACYATLALIQIALGQTNESKVSLAKGDELIRNRKEDWDLQLATEMLLNEARDLIEKKPLAQGLSK